MTDFETQIYSRQDDDVIGVQVIASSNNGQTIDSLQVTNKTQFDALVAKLDSLNMDYVQFDEDSDLKGLSLDEILTNSNEITTINATRLNGYQSDAFAKASHTHLKKSITDLYDYNISLSNYNVNAANSESVTITVKVTNTSNSPVKNHQVLLYRNNIYWKNGRTNSNGVYTVTYTPDAEGLTVFSVNNQKVQLYTKYDTGWVDIDMSNVSSNFRVTDPFQIRRIGKKVHIRGTIKASRNISVSNWEDYKDIGSFPDAQFAPSQDETFVMQSSSAQRCVVVIDSDGLHVGRFTAAASGGVYTIPTDLMIRVACTYFVD